MPDDGSVTRTVRLLLDSFPEPPARDTSVSHALLRRVAEGSEPETVRLHRPGAIVAFGPKDRLSPGYIAAIDAARERGFDAIERLAGGRAAVFHKETVAFSWVTPDPEARLHITRRFTLLAEMMRAAFAALGVDAQVGEVPGEYCPGQYSVNAGGKTKLMGVGQRLIAGAAHVGGVVVVGGSDRVRDVLIPVYQALQLDWDPATAGSLQDEVPTITWEGTVEAITDALGQRFVLEEGSVSTETLALAAELEPWHVPGPLRTPAVRAFGA
jgi:octanoyl-[GcvH]:protein N-octanoyltransferase